MNHAQDQSLLLIISTSQESCLPARAKQVSSKIAREWGGCDVPQLTKSGLTKMEVGKERQKLLQFLRRGTKRLGLATNSPALQSMPTLEPNRVRTSINSIDCRTTAGNRDFWGSVSLRDSIS